jgi:ABC-2 type transport system ATP-binding protein
MAAPAIETSGLTKSYGSLTALRDVSLAVERGEMFCLVGPDGAGKTTTLRILCGLVQPTHGGARILGFDLGREISRIKERIGYLSQRFSLYGDLTVDENIEFFAEIHGVSAFEKRRDELLDFTRLSPFRSRLADKLSGGMKQKLALACTLIHRPDIIFLDEPTTGVDPVSRREFWIILSNLLKSGITVFMTTPYLDEAERSTRVGLLDRGKLLVADTPARIKAAMTQKFVEIVCPDPRGAYALARGLPAVSDIQLFGDRLNLSLGRDVPAEGVIEALIRAGVTVSSWRPISPSLENVFISLIGGRAAS